VACPVTLTTHQPSGLSLGFAGARVIRLDAGALGHAPVHPVCLVDLH
jgi:hypothetical protein